MELSSLHIHQNILTMFGELRHPIINVITEHHNSYNNPLTNQGIIVFTTISWTNISSMESIKNNLPCCMELWHLVINTTNKVSQL